MSDQTAAELFADDIMRIVMERLRVNLISDGTNLVRVELYDNVSKRSMPMPGPHLRITASPPPPPTPPVPAITCTAGW